MLINLRNALMSGKRLPYDAEAEYLQSTGTQWINTGVVSSGIDIKCLMAFTDNTVANQGVFGSRVRSGDTGSNAYQIWYNVSSNNLRLDWASYTKSAAVSINTPVRIEAYQNGSVFVNGTEYTGNAKTANAYNFYIFNFNQGEALGATGCRAKVYSFQIWQNGVLVRDYIPVRKGTVGYLYDRVSGKLFGNAGTGDFVLGSDVVPVEYIESHGTEYIDIPVSGTPNEYFGIKGLVKITNTSQRSYGFWDTNIYRQFGSSGYDTSGADYLSASWVGAKNANGGWSVSPGVLYPFEVSTLGRTLLGEFQPLPRNITSAFSTLRLFGRYATVDYTENGSVAFGALTITDGTGNARNFRPIRVGTDATSWEGAMMDVLTRRIYRNAGTGAFTYGNDLKYPIPAS